MELKKRIVALDIGTKRIGIAISDVLWMGATPLKTINRNNDKSALDEIGLHYQESLVDVLLPLLTFLFHLHGMPVHPEHSRHLSEYILESLPKGPDPHTDNHKYHGN